MIHHKFYKRYRQKRNKIFNYFKKRNLKRPENMSLEKVLI